MRALQTLSKNFHCHIETNPTVLRIIETIDANHLTKSGFGIGISPTFFLNFLALMKEAGYTLKKRRVKMTFFNTIEQSVQIVSLGLKGVVDYYVMYCRGLQFFAIRSLADEEQKNVVPNNFFIPSVYSLPSSPLDSYVLTEGLSGNSFGSNHCLFESFGKTLIKLWPDNNKIIKEMSSGRFNQLIDTPQQLDNGERVFFYSIDEKFLTKLTNNSGRLKTDLVRTKTKGLVISEDNKLLGVYESLILPVEKGDGVRLIVRFIEESYVEKFVTLM